MQLPYKDFPDGSEGKASVCNAGDPGLIPGSGRSPLEKEMATHSSSIAWKTHGRRSLVGYSPWGHKDLDTTEQLHLSLSKLKLQNNLKYERS